MRHKHKKRASSIRYININRHTFSADALEAELMIMMAAEANNSFMVVFIIVVLEDICNI